MFLSLYVSTPTKHLHVLNHRSQLTIVRIATDGFILFQVIEVKYIRNRIILRRNISYLKYASYATTS